MRRREAGKRQQGNSRMRAENIPCSKWFDCEGIAYRKAPESNTKHSKLTALAVRQRLASNFHDDRFRIQVRSAGLRELLVHSRNLRLVARIQALVPELLYSFSGRYRPIYNQHEVGRGKRRSIM